MRAPRHARQIMQVRRWPAWLAGFGTLVILLALQATFTPAHLTLQLALFDAYQSLWPRVRQSAPAVVVAIDEPSLARYGQWPWPRNELARLVDNIAAHKPAGIGLDLLFPEQDRYSRRRDSGASDNDLRFAESLQAARAVLAVAGTDGRSVNGRGPFAPVAVVGEDPMPHLRGYRSVIRSTPVLDRAAAGHGAISTDTQGGIVRSLPVASLIENAIVPTLALEMIRVAAGEPAIRIRATPRGVVTVGTGDVAVPTAQDGHARIYFSPHDPSRFVSAREIMGNRIDAAQLQGKLVIIALTGLALVDYPATPLDARVPGAEIHVQMLENIFDGQYLSRPQWGRNAELAALALIGLLMVVVIPRARPGVALSSAALLIALVVMTGGVAFRAHGLLLDVAAPAVGLALVFIASLGSTLIELERQRRWLRVSLQTEREAAARVTGELEAAQRVQTGLLPEAKALTETEARCDIAAMMAPARVVGGDLYDFFKPAPDRLTFLVGDVSGKGLPASLFMAVSKALCKSAALRENSAVDTALTAANQEIARDNPEQMFVTVLLCSLDLESGRLDFANAGHDAPVLMHKAGGITRLDAAGGPPVCMINDYTYASASHTLSPGDTLFLYTDGVSEAMDADGRLYGRRRLYRLLEKLGTEKSCTEIIAAVQQDLQEFGAVEERADDITMLALRWLGPAARS
ncbi:MAG: SpoIIE family protein phosphatase [Betaproteobacteria bacterium]|nr:SpoIIE family protein phosphatase [Betaproteobacteria bacterium]